MFGFFTQKEKVELGRGPVNLHSKITLISEEISIKEETSHAMYEHWSVEYTYKADKSAHEYRGYTGESIAKLSTNL